MAARIEDYALVGDCRSAALISRQGSVGWLCWPRFGAAALFTSLLGTEAHGFWKIFPEAENVETSWAYRPGSLVLETRHKTRLGEVLVTDFMPVGDGSHLVRLVEGVHGRRATDGGDRSSGGEGSGGKGLSKILSPRVVKSN